MYVLLPHFSRTLNASLFARWQQTTTAHLKYSESRLTRGHESMHQLHISVVKSINIDYISIQIDVLLPLALSYDCWSVSSHP